jgi:16S rRNA (guanine527-N7)-methyltransferase
LFHVKHERHDPLDSLVARFSLAPSRKQPLATLLEILVDDPRAPTSIQEPDQVRDDHLADSLVALELAAVRNATAIADLGSGAGLPALPLAIALPAAKVTAVESNAHKAEFIARTAAVCSLDNVTVVTARAEEWTDGLGRCDLVTARALAPLAVVAEYAAPLLELGGTLVAWRGKRDPADEDAAAAAAQQLGLEVQPPVRVQPYPRAVHRHLHSLVKIAQTPERFPRRPGMARKRPLGAGSARTI